MRRFLCSKRPLNLFEIENSEKKKDFKHYFKNKFLRTMYNVLVRTEGLKHKGFNNQR